MKICAKGYRVGMGVGRVPTVLGLLACCVLAFAGCGGDSNVVPVSGTVTLNGDPLEGATVTFIPAVDASTKEAPSSFGKTDADGYFRLETPDGQRGAMIGKHEVRITKVEGDSDDSDDETLEFESEIPMKYNDATELTFEVSADGTDEANFALTADPGWQHEDRRRRRSQRGG